MSLLINSVARAASPALVLNPLAITVASGRLFLISQIINDYPAIIGSGTGKTCPDTVDDAHFSDLDRFSGKSFICRINDRINDQFRWVGSIRALVVYQMKLHIRRLLHALKSLLL
jgi:hypothetical protein